MRLLLAIIFVMMMSISLADQRVSEDQMMQQAKAAQECFAKIDQSNFEALEARGKGMESEIRALCSAGKRDEAMSIAIKYGKEFNASAEMQDIRKCSELMQYMMANMPKPYMPLGIDDDGDSGHVCDGM